MLESGSWIQAGLARPPKPWRRRTAFFILGFPSVSFAGRNAGVNGTVQRFGKTQAGPVKKLLPACLSAGAVLFTMCYDSLR